MIKLPVIENNKTLMYVDFKPNLNLSGVPAYVNEGGAIGLKRIHKGKYKGKLVFMYRDLYFPSSSFANFIDEEEAYDLCFQRGKFELINRLKIKPFFD